MTHPIGYPCCRLTFEQFFGLDYKHIFIGGTIQSLKPLVDPSSSTKMSSINKNMHLFGGFGIGVSSSTFIPLLVDWPVDSHSLPWNQVDGGKDRACRGANRGDNQAMISRGGSSFLGRQGGDVE